MLDLNYWVEFYEQNLPKSAACYQHRRLDLQNWDTFDSEEVRRAKVQALTILISKHKQHKKGEQIDL